VQGPGLKLVPDARLTAIASGRRAHAEAAARELSIPLVFDSGDELACSADVDLVIVASTPDTHARFSIAALESGKHVLCEKPMALDTGQAEAMVAAARAQPSRVSWVDHELRYEPNRRHARDLIRRGAVGELHHLEVFLKPYLRGDGRPQMREAPWSWWFDRARGGGILGAVGSHLIDLCRYWTGEEVSWVGGIAQPFVRRRRDEGGVEREVTADDFTSFVLRFTSGAVATVLLSTVAHHGPGHFAHITGSEGTLVLTGETKLEIGSPGRELEDVSVTDDLWERTRPNNMWARSFVRLMCDMVRTAEGAPGEGEPATFPDGLQVQRVLDAVRVGAGSRLH
jgi:predicted dehydrogenase